MLIDMLHKKMLSSILISVLMVSIVAAAPSGELKSDVQSLFLPIEQDIKADSLLPRIDKKFLKRSRFVSLDIDLLGGTKNTSPTKKIVLNLFNGESMVAILDNIKNIGVGGYVWIGKIEGIKLSRVIFSIKNGVITGKISTPKAIYEIKYAADNLYAIQELDQSAFPPELEPIPSPESTQSESISSSSDYAIETDSCNDITVMVVYSTEAKNAAGGSSQIESLINLAVTETNDSYENSGLVQRIRLVHTMETSESSNGFSTDMDALADTKDGIFDNVDTARETYSADMVALIIENSSSCGLAYLDSNASFAFSATDRSCATGNFSFGHELGHNMGAYHDWYADDADTYAHGFVNVTDGWRTIMAYDTLCTDQGEQCTRLQYWSNPDVDYNNDPMGVSSTGPDNCVKDSLTPNPSGCKADNRKKLNSTCSNVANFRHNPLRPLLKTGQTTVYAEYDDGHYQTGAVRSYSRSGNVVIDNVTGLEWQDDEVVQGTWEEAVTYCSDLPLDNGGWRLPSIEELETLVDNGRHDPAVTEGIFNHYLSTHSTYYSSTFGASSTDYPGIVRFNNGDSDYGSKYSSDSVRCVRGGQLEPSNLNRNGEIVTDGTTTLQWQDDAIVASTKRSWDAAIDYCENTLTLGGHDDWRLPNKNELLSIVDRSQDNPAIDDTVFVNTGSPFYWSSTSNTDSTYNAWYVDFRLGGSGYYSNDYFDYVRCVRGGQINQPLITPIIMYLLN